MRGVPLLPTLLVCAWATGALAAAGHGERTCPGLLAIAGQYADHPEAGLAAFAEEACEKAAGDESLAGADLLRLLEARPAEPPADKARFFLAELFDRRGDPLGAIQQLQRLREEFPSSPLAPLALERATLLHKVRVLARQRAGEAWRLDDSFLAAARRAGLKGPRAVAAAEESGLWIADEKAGAVVVLGSAGEVVSRLPVEGPTAVAASPGSAVRIVGRLGVGPPRHPPAVPAAPDEREGAEPRGVRRVGAIAVASDGRVLLLDSGERKVLWFSPEMQFESELPMPPGSLLAALAADPDGGVWLGAAGGREAVLLDRTGRELRRVSLGAEGPASIRGLACDGAGDLYILDDKTLRVHVFDRAGRLVAAFDLMAGASGLSNPDAIAVDRAGRVYVTSHRPAGIARFR